MPSVAARGEQNGTGAVSQPNLYRNAAAKLGRLCGVTELASPRQRVSFGLRRDVSREQAFDIVAGLLLREKPDGTAILSLSLYPPSEPADADDPIAVTFMWELQFPVDESNGRHWAGDTRRTRSWRTRSGANLRPVIRSADPRRKRRIRADGLRAPYLQPNLNWDGLAST